MSREGASASAAATVSVRSRPPRAFITGDERSFRALASEKIDNQGDCVHAGAAPLSAVRRLASRLGAADHVTNGLSGPGLLPGIGDR